MRLISLAALSLLAACTSGEIVPTEGEWKYVALEYTEDSCGAADAPATSVTTLETLAISLVLTDDGFTLATPDGDPVELTLDGDEFAGEASLSWTVSGWQDADGNEVEAEIALTLGGDVTGSFVDENNATFEANLQGTCEGDACADYLAAAGITEDPCVATLVGEMAAQ